jgi:hypothetical protein
LFEYRGALADFLLDKNPRAPLRKPHRFRHQLCCSRVRVIGDNGLFCVDNGQRLGLFLTAKCPTSLVPNHRHHHCICWYHSTIDEVATQSRRHTITAGISDVDTATEYTVVLATGPKSGLQHWPRAESGTLDGQEPGAQKRNPTVRSMTDGSACDDWSCVARRASALFPRG